MIGAVYVDCAPIINTYMKKKTLEKCIDEFKEIHGNRYGYDAVEYDNTHTKVDISCDIHGMFRQSPKQHLRGNGCPRCAGHNKTTEIFIEEAKEIHGETYDYSLVNYKAATTKIKIVCSIHGEFVQRPNDHLQGNGCPGCFIKRTKSNEQFIIEAKEIHGETYDYSLVNYKASHKKVKIICNVHGVFTQRPNDHLHMNGCPCCARRGYLPSKGGRIYYIQFISDKCTFYKIGITNGDVDIRIKRLQVDEEFVVNILFDKWFEDGNIPKMLESNILKKFKRNTFMCAKKYIKSGYSETFNYDIFDNTQNYTRSINQYL